MTIVNLATRHFAFSASLLLQKMFSIVLVLVALIFITLTLAFLNKLWNERKVIPSVGKCVLITGCDSGVGLQMAITCRNVGFQVIASCLDANASDGAKLLKEKYPDILVIRLDVTRPQDVAQAKEKVLQHIEETNTLLWALINNAGVLVYGHFDWQLEQQVMSQIQVNFIGVLRVTRTFLPLLQKAKGM